MARMTDTERATKQAQKVEAERAKLAALQARIQAKERKTDTRRKIIIGGTVLAAMKDDTTLQAQMVALLRRKLTRPQDKAAFPELFAASFSAA